MLIGIDGNEANTTNRVGSGRYAIELLKQFVKIKNQKFLIFLKEKPLPDLPAETENFKYKVFGPKKLWTQFALPLRLTFGSKPDVFFSMAHYGPRYSKVPYVVTIHDLSYLHFPQLFKKDDLLQLTNWSKYSILNSAHVITPSKSTQSDVIKNYPIAQSKVAVTYEGYDSAIFKPCSQKEISAVKAKYKIKGDYIIFVGTLQPRKNIQRLIEAFSILISPQSKGRGPHGPVYPQFSSLNLVIVGRKGWLYDSILDKSKNLGIENKVIFTDFVPDQQLPALLSGARAYVNPSLWEGFGIPIIEAQACGVPVVVSNTSSLPEIVGDSGILVDPQDVKAIAAGIKKVLNDEKIRINLVKKGLENTKRFSWEDCSRQTLQILTKHASK